MEIREGKLGTTVYMDRRRKTGKYSLHGQEKENWELQYTQIGEGKLRTTVYMDRRRKTGNYRIHGWEKEHWELQNTWIGEGKDTRYRDQLVRTQTARISYSSYQDTWISQSGYKIQGLDSLDTGDRDQLVRLQETRISQFGYRRKV